MSNHKMRWRTARTRSAVVVSLMATALLCTSCSNRKSQPLKPQCDEEVYQCIRDKLAASKSGRLADVAHLREDLDRCRSVVVDSARRCCPPELSICSDGDCLACGPCQMCGGNITGGHECSDACAHTEVCQNGKCIKTACPKEREPCKEHCCAPGTECTSQYKRQRNEDGDDGGSECSRHPERCFTAGAGRQTREIEWCCKCPFGRESEFDDCCE